MEPHFHSRSHSQTPWCACTLQAIGLKRRILVNMVKTGWELVPLLMVLSGFLWFCSQS